MATGDACKKVMILPKLKSVLECLFTCTELNQGHGYLLVSEEVHIHIRTLRRILVDQVELTRKHVKMLVLQLLQKTM